MYPLSPSMLFVPPAALFNPRSTIYHLPSKLINALLSTFYKLFALCSTIFGQLDVLFGDIFMWQHISCCTAADVESHKWQCVFDLTFSGLYICFTRQLTRQKICLNYVSLVVETNLSNNSNNMNKLYWYRWEKKYNNLKLKNKTSATCTMGDKSVEKLCHTFHFGIPVSEMLQLALHSVNCLYLCKLRQFQFHIIQALASLFLQKRLNMWFREICDYRKSDKHFLTKTCIQRQNLIHI